VKENIILPLVGLVGTIADYVTTKIGLQYPEITELNPLVNPALEGTFAVGGPILISVLGDKLKVDRSLKISLMAVPASIPLVIGIRNLVIIGTVNARRYLITEFPLIYW